jgi:flagellar biosynthetic protein FliP
MATATISPGHRPALAFLRHLGEMTLAMFAGMFAFGMALGVAGADSLRTDQPELFMLGMGCAMSITMVAWMRRRRSTWRQCCEMTAAMFVPVLAVFALYWAGTVTVELICPLSCVLMIPAMAAAMAIRRR